MGIGRIILPLCRCDVLCSEGFWSLGACVAGVDGDEVSRSTVQR